MWTDPLSIQHAPVQGLDTWFRQEICNHSYMLKDLSKYYSEDSRVEGSMYKSSRPSTQKNYVHQVPIRNSF